MHLLITNDDGIDAPGLLALAQALGKDFRISILAPDRNWSACGHIKTLNRPLHIQDTILGDGIPAFVSDGTPSDCVALAMLGFIQDPVDMVVSGINPLANLGQDLTYSGTVMAAMEAAIFGVPGIAFSLDQNQLGDDLRKFHRAAGIAASVIRQIAAMQTSEPFLLNINIPDRPREEMRGVTITRQGTRIYRDTLEFRPDSNGQPSYWIAGDAPSGVLEPGTDFWALAHGYVSITPLSLDLTDQDGIASTQTWPLKL